MNRIRQTGTTWRFPKRIPLDYASSCAGRFRPLAGEHVTFDLSETTYLHSSFIGFMIHARHTLRRRGGSLSLRISLTVKQILVLAGIFQWFAPDTVTVEEKKTA